MYKVLLGGFIIGAMAVGCSQGGPACTHKTMDKGMANQHLSSICVYNSGTTCKQRRYKYGGSIKECIDLNGSVTITSTHEDAVEVH